MKTRTHVVNIIAEAILKEMANSIPSEELSEQIEIEIPKNADIGDFSTNFAMKNAKLVGKNPRELADNIVQQLNSGSSGVTASVAGPGFINLKMPLDFWQTQVLEILKSGQDYGRINLGKSLKTNIEFVSANPTGPMHIGHVRGAVMGQILCNILSMAGYDVTREYYINDAGLQVEKLGKSAYLRYREALGEKIEEIPDGLYPGEYLIAVGEALAKDHGRSWIDKQENEWLPVFRAAAIEAMLRDIKQDLLSLDIHFDVFSSEKALVLDGKVDETIEILKTKDLVYMGTLPKPQSENANENWTPEPLPLFRSSQFGDDVDRPLKKSDGELTYFASDIAYHYDKFRRGHKLLINIWGADHAGYIPRLTSAVSAVTENACNLEIKTCQMVKLMRGNEEVRMSKRAGTFVTLRDLIDDVGKDVIFFIVATKTGNTPFNFDLDAVKRTSMDNPVFYVQYAHARAHSVISKSGYAEDDILSADMKHLSHPQEILLVRKMNLFTRAIQSAAEKREPHIITDYLYDLAASFHSLWNLGKQDETLRFIQEDEQTSRAKVALVLALKTVLANGLRCCNVTPQETMEREVSEDI